MGACLGYLPATRNDVRKLHEDYRELHDDYRGFRHNVETTLYRIDRNVQLLCDEILCPTTESIPSNCTVAIDNVGHGLLIRNDRSEYLIITAAHVAIEFLQKGTVNLKWISSNISIEGKVEGIFIPKQYVENGGCDVGAIKIEIDKDEGVQLTEKYLSISQNSQSEGVVVGEGTGNFHIRGERVQPSEKKNRLVVHAHSKPGMSGLPLFQADGMLACLIHGDSKHRGGHTRSEDGYVSALLYGDYISSGLTLFHVNKKYTNALLQAEKLSPDIAEYASHLPNGTSGELPQEYKEFCRAFSTELQSLQEGTAILDDRSKSFDTMMSYLANQCFDEDDIHCFGQGINAIFPVKPDGDAIKFEHEMSLGHKGSLSKLRTPTPVKKKREIQQSAGEQSGQACM